MADVSQRTLIPIADIEADSSIYPRASGADPRRVSRYAACMRDGDSFPPIEVEAIGEGKYRVLDGLHRIEASREVGSSDISATIVSLDNSSALLYAAKQNRHGKDLSDNDAESIAQREFERNPRVTNKEIAQAVGRSESTISGYLRDLRARHDIAQDLTIFKLTLLGIPQERIAARLGLKDKQTVDYHCQKTSDLANSVKGQLQRGFSVNTIAEKLDWPEPLVWAVALEGKEDKERFKTLGWNVRPWDYWNWGDVDSRFGDDWAGRIPGQLVGHALYFFTEPGALVFDPMAGGGVTPDVCLALNRRCWSFDKVDRTDSRPEIECHQWDLDKPAWPVVSKSKPDLVFFDPPYFKKKEEEYGPDSISALPRPEYLRFFALWSVLAAENSKPSTRLALLVADWRDFESTAATLEDPSHAVTIFDYMKGIEAGGWELTHRIECPLSSERFTGHMVSAMQDRRSLGTVGRTLLMCRRK